MRRDESAIDRCAQSLAATPVAPVALPEASSRADNAVEPCLGSASGPVISSRAFALKRTVDGGPHRSPRIARS